MKGKKHFAITDVDTRGDYCHLSWAASAALDWAFAGPLWVSAGGGTANCLAGAIAKHCGVGFDTAMDALDRAGGPGWYSLLSMRVGEECDWPKNRDAKGVIRFLDRQARREL